ncbi:MAG: putative DNA modification/repair radical SAM protein [Oscillospiraceae bacterium]|jgi:putative DNA modification/repair radical SAM protein|nr:putative DNA modification/repair radical SAM protein [Oscillospiraceae bacterium]
MDLMEKLTILANGAKYDAACTSSGADRAPTGAGIGSSMPCGCCHSFAADGRCISLLKVLMTNACAYDCAYCVNRRSSNVPRATFSPEELAQLTIQFYRRNYIEGLFLSSGVWNSPDATMERMVRVLELLRRTYQFHGYLHVKVIPGASEEMIRAASRLADRVSVNIEFPSERSLRQFAPDKTRSSILRPMGQIKQMIDERQTLLLPSSGQKALAAASGATALATRHNRPNGQPLAAAGQATQMIIGASPESDYHILRLAEGLYQKYSLKRVFYSAYIPVVEHSLLPAPHTQPPLLREHRLYQADFLLRQYGFTSAELLDETEPNFNPYLDPKCNWALRHPAFFPVDVQRASLEQLLRVPGIGPRSARRIVAERRRTALDLAALKRMGVVLKRAQFFLIAADRPRGTRLPAETVARALLDPKIFTFGMEQLSLFAPAGLPAAQDIKSIGQAAEEAVHALARDVRAA